MYSVIPAIHDVHVVIHAELFIYGITSVLKAHFCIYITPEWSGSVISYLNTREKELKGVK